MISKKVFPGRGKVEGVGWWVVVRWNFKENSKFDISIEDCVFSWLQSVPNHYATIWECAKYLKILILRQSCDSFCVQNLQETTFVCPIATDNFCLHYCNWQHFKHYSNLSVILIATTHINSWQHYSLYMTCYIWHCDL